MSHFNREIPKSLSNKCTSPRLTPSQSTPFCFRGAINKFHTTVLHGICTSSPQPAHLPPPGKLRALPSCVSWYFRCLMLGLYSMQQHNYSLYRLWAQEKKERKKGKKREKTVAASCCLWPGCCCCCCCRWCCCYRFGHLTNSRKALWDPAAVSAVCL